MVIPKVKKLTESNGVFEIPERLTYSASCELGALGGAAFADFSGAEMAESGGLVEFFLDDTLEERDEIYSVKVLPSKIYVGFRDARGAVCGAATVALLLRREKVECCEIVDYPSSSYRSFLLDMARGLPAVEDIEETVKYLALAKYNRLHLHLMDARGLCYRSEAFPEFKYLPPEEERPANNYGQYDKSVMRDIAALCDRYAIEIVPEIEIPAHATVLCETHPEFKCRVEAAQGWALCPGNDDVWDFYRKLVGEVTELFPRCQYVHIGTDELEFADLPEGRKRLCHWDECPRCRALREREGLADRREEFYYVVKKMREIVTSFGKKMMMWNEQIDVSREVPVSRDIVMQFWRIAHPGRGPYEGCSLNGLLEKGFTVINSYYPCTYVDVEKYMNTEIMKGWTPKTLPEHSEEYSDQIIGGEACAWEMGNYQEYPFYGYTLPPCIALFGDKVWGHGEREYDEEYKKALSEFVFGLAEYSVIFDLVGGLIPPRSKETFTYLDPEAISGEKLTRAIEMLEKRKSSVTARAYLKLLKKISEARNN